MEEYQQYARPYSPIFNFIAQTTDMSRSEVMSSWTPNEDELYAKRQAWLQSSWVDLRLSEGEISFWQERENQIETPYVYQEHGGYSTLFSTYQTVGILVLMLVSICLSGIFSDEHTMRTDQINLSCSLGKTRLYWAKITTGISFAVVSTLLLLAFTFVITICLYGANGFSAAFQLIYSQNSDPITCGQAIVIAYGTMVLVAIIASVSIMVFSELLRSNITVLAVSTALLIMGMVVAIPEQCRILAQIWDWFPCRFLTPWIVFGQYTLSALGHYFTAWQAVPIIYLVASIVIATVGKPIYQRFQVSGR